jgi:quercetin dioxygenase-like cupin family protein
MGFMVYDYREDVRNVLVTPQIRSRFMRMETGEDSGAHSDDLGQEVFLVLQGRAEFTIDG